MKLVTPEIFWHGRDPLYSVDFQFGDWDVQRIATCGTDKMIRIWSIKSGPVITYLSTLNRHHKTVNVVRFSPDGKILASGGDDSAIILWKLSPSPANNANNFVNVEEEEAKENWIVLKMLRSHLEDIYDLSWSQDGRQLVSGSVDNTAVLWDVKKGHKLWMFTDHKSFVQGVSFDPLGTFIATMSSDRACRIYQRPNNSIVSEIKKLPPSFLAASIPSFANCESKKLVNIFHDDLMKSFFRRLAFSPDGQLLVVPSGCYGDINDSPDHNVINSTTFVFTRKNLTKPALHLPVPAWCKTTLAVKFSPFLYKLRPVLRKDSIETEAENAKELWLKYSTLFKLAYRMVFAVATDNSVLIYDTQQIYPLSIISNIHYHTISDLSWSEDGLILMVASTDGYCSVVTFEPNELGELYENQKIKKMSDGNEMDQEESFSEENIVHTHLCRRKVPTISVPITSVPNILVPGTSVPNTLVPDISVPNMSVPNTSIPDLSVTNISVPNTSIPLITVPDTSVPDTSVASSLYSIDLTVLD